MFSRLSSETIYRRFHTPYPRVPEWLLELLMDAGTDAEGGPWSRSSEKRSWVTRWQLSAGQ